MNKNSGDHMASQDVDITLVQCTIHTRKMVSHTLRYGTDVNAAASYTAVSQSRLKK